MTAHKLCLIYYVLCKYCYKCYGNGMQTNNKKNGINPLLCLLVDTLVQNPV